MPVRCFLIVREKLTPESGMDRARPEGKRIQGHWRLSSIMPASTVLTLLPAPLDCVGSCLAPATHLLTSDDSHHVTSGRLSWKDPLSTEWMSLLPTSNPTSTAAAGAVISTRDMPVQQKSGGRLFPLQIWGFLVWPVGSIHPTLTWLQCKGLPT